MKKKKIVALMGEAGTGKDYIVNYLTKYNPLDYHKIIHDTTRPLRQGEKNNKDYHFIYKEQFQKNKETNCYIETSCFNNWYYGTNFEELLDDKVNIGVFSPTSVRQLQENKDIELTVFYVRADDKERLLRQLNRETYPDVKEIVRRFSADKEDFASLDDIKYIDVFNIDKSAAIIINNFVNGLFS